MSIFLMGTAWGNESAFEIKILEVIFWKLGVHCKNYLIIQVIQFPIQSGSRESLD